LIFRLFKVRAYLLYCNTVTSDLLADAEVPIFMLSCKPEKLNALVMENFHTAASAFGIIGSMAVAAILSQHTLRH